METSATADVKALLDCFLAVISLYRLHDTKAEDEAIHLLEGDNNTPPLAARVFAVIDAVSRLEGCSAA